MLRYRVCEMCLEPSSMIYGAKIDYFRSGVETHDIFLCSDCARKVIGNMREARTQFSASFSKCNDNDSLH